MDMTGAPAFYRYGQSQPSVSPVYNYGQSFPTATPVLYGYVVGFLPVQAINLQPYIQSMAATMPFFSGPMSYTGVFDRAVSPINYAYPVIMSPQCQAPLNGLLQNSIPVAPAAPPYDVDAPQPKKEPVPAAKQGQVPAEPQPKLDANNKASTAPEDSPAVKTREDFKPEKSAAESAEMPPELEAKLRKAMKKKDNEKVIQLLAGNPITKWVNGHGENLLFIACECKNLTIAKALLQAGVKVNQADKDGNTALHMACEKGKPDLVQMLLDCGANSLLGNHSGGITPLHIAAEHNNAQLMGVLADNLIDKKKQDQINLGVVCGYTPLMIAAAKGHSKTVGALLEYGADPWLEVSSGDHKGKTAYDFANMHWRHFRTRRKLDKHMKRSV